MTDPRTHKPTDNFENSADDLPFAELARQYNFLNISSYPRVMTNLIVKEVQQYAGAPRVLDIGCGHGLGRNVDLQWEIKQASDELWGIEPDTSVHPTQGLFDNFQHALLESADLPPNSIDVAYSSMVMEHVSDPDSFFNAVKACLKPGGIYLFLTPNAQSFVPRMTKIAHNLRIDEILLRMIRGKQQVEQYHYPVEFRCNTVARMNHIANRLGFDSPEFAFIEGHGSRTYFPGPLRLLYNGLTVKRRWIKTPQSLTTLICRLVKPVENRGE